MPYVFKILHYNCSSIQRCVNSDKKVWPRMKKVFVIVLYVAAAAALAAGMLNHVRACE